MILEAETHIRADPEDVFEFFAEMEQNYEAWHPDHITFRWVEGVPVEEGTLAYFEEEIGGEVMKKTVEYVTVESNRRVELKPTSRLMGFFLPFIKFTIEPVGEGCVFTQQIKIRTGPIGKRLNQDEFDAVHQHMKEEGENLRRLLEKEQESDAVKGG
ncbi:SRPBCC family protein [Natronococcus sp. A-GB7]|uniref:SRPBCC family protein n=1 Tax=Natronococcus sp. A-GB7 TaxID=3037649 RepID=UPI00241CF53A|nr:SRPBCC family protein [Natronococcus sp. A-GB7]MDG5820904.1 SRPBCC family protein [Natronococcus sp. A-GB7]